MNKYVLFVHEFDTTTGTHKTEPLYKKYMSSEDFLSILLSDVSKETLALPEPSRVGHVVNGKKKGRKPGTVYNCTVCGKPGHTSKTCVKNTQKVVTVTLEKPKAEPKVEPPKQRSQSETDTRSHRARVQELWEGGLDVEEVVESLPDIEMAEIHAIYRDLERKRND